MGEMSGPTRAKYQADMSAVAEDLGRLDTAVGARPTKTEVDGEFAEVRTEVASGLSSVRSDVAAVDARIDDLPVGGGVVEPSYTYGLGKMQAGLRRRNARAVLFICDGSSTTAGNNATTAANRFVNKLAARFQAAYPLTSGSSPAVRTLAEAVAAAPLTPGVQFVNNGKGGTESIDFISTADINNYAAIAPATGVTVVQHIVGSNDWSHAIPVATFKANLTAKVNQIKAAFGSKQMIQVISSTYGRIDSSAIPTAPATAPVAPWSSYVAAMKEVVAASPEGLVFFDISPAFRAAGIPATGSAYDPFDLIDTDEVHMRDEGHDLFAELLWNCYMQAPAPLAAPAVPTVINTTAPAITGTVLAGQTLTVSNGAWTPAPSGFTRQWYRTGTAIAGATGATYTLTTADDGQSIYAVVTATAGGFQPGVAASNTVNPVSATTITNTAAPVITASGQIGGVASTTDGSWTNSPTGFAYQWLRDGALISGATASTYTPVAADGDTVLSVRITASRSGFDPGTATSAGKAITAPLPGTIVTSDTFSGAAGSLSSTSTDASLGGAQRSYGTIPGSLFLRDGNGNATINSAGSPATGNAAFDLASSNQHLTLSVGPLSAASVWMDVRKGSTVVSAATYRLQLAPVSGTAYLVSRPSGATTIGKVVSVDFTVGHTFMVSVADTTSGGVTTTTLRWWMGDEDGSNMVLMDTVVQTTPTIASGLVAAITTTSTAVGALRSFVMRAL